MSHHAYVPRYEQSLRAKLSIHSGYLSGEQSRIQLQLALAAGYEDDYIRQLFEGELRRAVYNDTTAFYNGTDY